MSALPPPDSCRFCGGQKAEQRRMDELLSASEMWAALALRSVYILVADTLVSTAVYRLAAALRQAHLHA